MNDRSQPATKRRFTPWTAAILLLLALGTGLAWAQQEPPTPIDGGPPPDDGASSRNANAIRLPVRGVVRSSLSGEGVSRALVQIEGDAQTGVLTAGDGSFELPAVPSGPQTLTVTKPGYQDRPFGGAAVELLQGNIGRESIHTSGNHSVVVAPGMPDLVFVIGPAAAIEGSIQFANGEPAPAVNVQLARRSVESGHMVWQIASQSKTRANGAFRFGSLIPGEYSVYTTPFLDADAPHFADDETAAADTPADTREATGYPSIYFPDAHEPDTQSPIVLAAGQTQQIALTLTPETFHRVSVGVASGSLASSRANGSLLDASGRMLEYRASYDAHTNSLIALLPDGNYQMRIATTPQLEMNGPRQRIQQDPSVGMAEFTVSGKPLLVPRVALVPQQPPAIQINTLGGSASTRENRNAEMVVLANPASGWIDDGVVSAYASGPITGPLKATYTIPGAYWLHPQLAEENLCEDSLTAAGAPMGREPVHVAVGGSTPPLTLSLRHDCAQLTLLLPASVMSFAAGEEPYYTVYILPDFDFTHDVNEITLRPTSGESLTVGSLTPGHYRVYTFAGPHPLAYHDRALLAKLPSQEVTLQPAGKAELTLEVPAP
jgi:hypothetical protein